MLSKLRKIELGLLWAARNGRNFVRLPLVDCVVREGFERGACAVHAGRRFKFLVRSILSLLQLFLKLLDFLLLGQSLL